MMHLCAFLLGMILPSQLLGQTVVLAESHPGHQDEDVLISGSLSLRFSDAVNPNSLSAIRLEEITPTGTTPVEICRSTDLTNASVTVVPVDFLKTDQEYRIVGSTALQAATGQPVTPFEVAFRTEDGSRGKSLGLTFQPKTFDTQRSMTTVLFGPDRRLYAASAFGEIVVWNVAKDGRPTDRKTIFQDATYSRQFIDLEWDPAATPDHLVLWASYAERLCPKGDPAYYFTGAIARLTILDQQIIHEEVMVRGLPHGREIQGGHETLPHQPNGLCFHNGMLYQSVGSTSSSGGPANWGIQEQRLSSSILEIDYQRIPVGGIDVSPTNPQFDPQAPGALVRHFATGVRNALELVVHSNGRMYTAVNINDRGKRSDGVPNDPRIPGDQNALITQITPNHESLLILERGRHYGFPNPSLGNFVLGGGNPTAEKDPFEITDYPVGTPPEQGFAPELMFPIWEWGGTSPNGILEYSPQFEHPLQSSILCCFYSSNDIAAMILDQTGLPVRIEKLRGQNGKLSLAGPLDITQDTRTGHLYVADFGKQSKFGEDGSMVWLQPVPLGTQGNN